MAGGKPGRPPGHPKSGGRKKGTPNVLPFLQKSVAQEFKERDISPLDEIIKLIPTVSNEMQLNTWMRLMQYCYAALKTIEVKADINNTVQATPANVEALWMQARNASANRDLQGIVAREISDTIDTEILEPTEEERLEDESLNSDHIEPSANNDGCLQIDGVRVDNREG